ncbi:MAG: ABC transporter ATP-binding protein [Treponema sp.]|nr:ABC transporter ATP-binding protein [Treponema sp.]
MNFLKFENVHFSYPAVEGDVDEDGKQIQPPVIFDHFSAELPAGFVSLVGPNGSGKSTFMLLAAGRVLPQAGGVFLLNQNTGALNQDSRDELASYIYQNMELDTDEKTGALLDYVYQNGKLCGAASGVLDSSKNFIDEVKAVFEVQDLSDKSLAALSKGQLQRALICFSLLYGSKSIFMDEPFFAMEERQKENTVKYLKEYSKATCVPIYISMHELDLTKKYADTVMLFYPNHDIDLGTVEEVLTDEALEKAYGVPASMLKQSEELSREQIARRLNF